MMAIVLRRSCFKIRDNFILPTSKQKKIQLPSGFFALIHRNFCDGNTSPPDFTSSTILVESRFNVQELPVVVRKMTNVTRFNDETSPELVKHVPASVNYNAIQAEFKKCDDLKDIFSVLSKCTKIAPSFALGAMERIYYLEKKSNAVLQLEGDQFHLAKGAVLEKLLKVVEQAEDTDTILSILKSSYSFTVPYKHKFCDELLFRTIDNELSMEQLCAFIEFLAKNKSDPKYAETIDKLWVGILDKEADIDANNIALVFNALPGLKESKKIILGMVEQKLSDLWYKIKIPVMQEILSSLIMNPEMRLSSDSFTIIGKWLYDNIHSVDEDSLLDVVCKLTRLNYTDPRVEKAIEKYVTLKKEKIKSYVFIVGILNYCVHFKIRNSNILNLCSHYFVKNSGNISASFLKSFLHPFGLLHFDPENSSEFWKIGESILEEQYLQIKPDDLCSIILSYIYVEKYPLDIVSKIFSSEYLIKINNPEVMKRLHLIDTALSLECKEYRGPMLPKDQWCPPMSQDFGIKNLVSRIHPFLEELAGGCDKMSLNVMIPHFSDETYLIDVMLHPPGLDTKLNWKGKSLRNENTALLIQLPAHYCSDNEKLMGPQVMRKKHLRILGFKVASLKHSILTKHFRAFNKTNTNNDLRDYLKECLDNAEDSL